MVGLVSTISNVVRLITGNLRRKEEFQEDQTVNLTEKELIKVMVVIKTENKTETIHNRCE